MIPMQLKQGFYFEKMLMTDHAFYWFLDVKYDTILSVHTEINFASQVSSYNQNIEQKYKAIKQQRLTSIQTHPKTHLNHT